MRHLPLVATVVVLTGIIHAEDSTPPIVVTADRREEDLARTPSSVSVIDADDIHDRGYPLRVADLLGQMPSSQIITSGGLSGVTSLRLRGTQSHETQVLVDGIPLDDPAGIKGNPDLSYLNSAGITRIEEVRGAQSGLYGSHAVGGVINLITARPTDTPHAEARVEAGSFRTMDGSALATGPLGGGLGYVLGISAIQSDGISAKTDPGANGNPDGHERDGFRRLGVNARLEQKLAAGSSLYAAFNLVNARSEFDGNDPITFVGLPDDPVPVELLHSWRASVGGVARLSPQLDIKADAAHSAYDREYPNASAAFDTREFDSSEDYGSLRAIYSAPADLKFTLGADGRRGAAELTAPDGSTQVDDHDQLIGVWTQAAWSPKQAELNATVRHDDHDREGSATTYRFAGALFGYDQQLKVFASVGTGFRAPSLYELHAPGFGNPDLQAERSISYETGIRLGPPDLSWTSTVFRTDYRSRIGFGATGFINSDDGSWVEGLENVLELRPHASPWSIGATHTWQVSDDGSGGSLPYLPTNEGGLIITYRRQRRWWINGRLDLVGSRPTVSGPRMDHYATLGAAAGWRFLPNWEVYVRGDNLTDTHYEELDDFGDAYSTVGRSGYVGLVGRF